jgi:signal transduction histidine kinase
LWVGTNKGVSVWKDGAFIEHFTTENGLTNNIVRAVYCDAMGTMWIGTQNGVARIHTNRRVEKFLYEHGLTNAMVWDFAEDRDGGLYITTFDGLTRLSNSTFTNYSTRHGLASNLVPSTYMQHEKNAKGERTEHIWIATERGLHKTTREYLRAPKIEPLPKIDEVHVNFATFPDGRLLSATYGGSLWQLSPTRTRIPMPGGYPRFIPTALATHGKNTILYGSIGGLDVWHKGSFRRYTKQDGLSGLGARALLTNIHDTIYVGVDGGVDVATFSENGEITSISPLCDTLLLPKSVRVRALYRDAHGVLWIGTFGQGVYRFEKRNSTPLVTKFTQAHGFEDDVAYSIIEDEYGRLWFAGHSGVSIAPKSELDDIAHGTRTRANVRLLTMAHGLGSNLMLGGTGSPAVFDSNGYAWFASRGGLGRMHRDSIITIGAVPHVIIEEIHSDSLRVFPADYAQGGNLPTFPAARANRMEFQYTAPVFNDAEHLTFYSMLEGYDEKWIEWGNRRTAYYTNLPRGKTFTFRVKVRTGEGVWSKEETTFTFYIEPYFYETWWFYTLCVLVLAGIVYGIFIFRLRRLRRRNELLKALVEERTARLSAANEELATTNAELAHANEFKTEMLGIVAHDLKNPLTTISMGTNVVSSELQSGEDINKEQIIEINAMVIHAATRMNRLIEDLLDVTSLDMRSLTLSPSDFDLSELLKAIVQEYLPKAHAKSQTLVLHAPNTLIIHADAHRLRQVLDNIVSNAVKFSATDKEISITAEEHEQECIMRVRDGGPGFLPEDMQEMFRPFRKLSARPTGGESSTGMGLNIVKQIVELHGGTVDMRNHPEGGAEFTIRLPRTPR